MNLEAMRQKHEIMKLESNYMGKMLDLEARKNDIKNIENDMQITKNNIVERIEKLSSEHGESYKSVLI